MKSFFSLRPGEKSCINFLQDFEDKRRKGQAPKTVMIFTRFMGYEGISYIYKGLSNFTTTLKSFSVLVTKNYSKSRGVSSCLARVGYFPALFTKNYSLYIKCLK